MRECLGTSSIAMPPRMLALRDYLGLTLPDAQMQWLEIARRAELGTKRQPDFTAVETLLCFGLGLVALPSPSGRVNLRESDPVVKSLARLVKRRPSSLAAKLANLDGRRPHGAKHEPALWAELTENFSIFEALYDVILTAGRQVGLSEVELPDFLGAADFTLRSALDADQTTPDELQVLVEDDLREWFAAHPEGDFSLTERAMLGTARVGQKQFARRVLENSEYSCVFCGLSFRDQGLPSSRMLVASHIKPWRHSSNEERVDLRNGLAACPTHDAAFDGLLFTLDSELNIVRGLRLQLAVDNDPTVARNFGPDGMRSSLRMTQLSKAPGAAYLDWHRELAMKDHKNARTGIA